MKQVIRTSPKLYRPNKVKNVVVSASVVASWATLLHEAVFVVKDITSIEGIALVPCITFLYTGLFITGHDAMHGNITNNRFINDGIGHVCTNLYAGLDFGKMRQKHMLHHVHTGIVREDPDFHKGDSAFYKWFLSFMAEYTDMSQALKLTFFIEALRNSGAPNLNIYVYIAACGILSALQLFYFGTYIPHRPPKDHDEEVMNWEKSKSSSKGKLESFLTCYHFDCHYEHHAFPHIPWFDLWDVKNHK
jgi:beta-carotene ketolase (CrtW type)